MNRTTCSACGSPHLDIFLDLGLSPVADAYTSSQEEVSVRYPLEVAVCGECRLVQLLEVLNDATLFGTGYSFYSSASPPLSAYHGKYAHKLIHSYADLASRFVVEIGCNDGDLLNHFPPSSSLGIDPAIGPTTVARERGLNIHQEAFSSTLAKEVLNQNGPAGIVIANHVIAHVADVADFLIGLNTLVADDGIVMIEVQYLPDLIVNNAFDLVYHEHRNFFSLTSLGWAAEHVGLHIIDAELTSRQGGSLRATLAKKPIPSKRVDDLRMSEYWLLNWGPYAGFQGRVDRIRTRLLDILLENKSTGRMMIGYGAPAKATTLLNYCGITSDLVSWVVDSTPAKQNRFIPGTGIQILSPETVAADVCGPLARADVALVLAWNYLSEIMRNNKDFTGSWVSPIPAPVVL